MVAAWGGFTFVVNAVGCHAFCLAVVGRYTEKLRVAYSLFYVVGTVGAILVPVVGWPTKGHATAASNNDHVLAAAASAHAVHPTSTVVLCGASFGCRVVAEGMARDPPPYVSRTIVLCGYPLIGQGGSSPDRTGHLLRLPADVHACFVEGDKDTFLGPTGLASLREVAGRMRATCGIYELKGGTHHPQSGLRYPNSGLLIGSAAGLAALSAAFRNISRYPCCPRYHRGVPTSWCHIDDQHCLQARSSHARQPRTRTRHSSSHGPTPDPTWVTMRVATVPCVAVGAYSHPAGRPSARGGAATRCSSGTPKRFRKSDAFESRA